MGLLFNGDLNNVQTVLRFAKTLKSAIKIRHFDMNLNIYFQIYTTIQKFSGSIILDLLLLFSDDYI